MAALDAGGRSFHLRADLNAIGEIQERLGGLDAKCFDGVKAQLTAAAIMINEHFFFTGSPERITPEELGARLGAEDASGLYAAVAAALREGVGNPKNA